MITQARRKTCIQMSVVAAVLCLSAAGLFPSAASSQRAGQAPAAEAWYGRMAKMAVQPTRIPGLRFQFEYPAKDWVLLSAAGPVPVLAATRRLDAVFVVEEASLNRALDQADITDVFAQIETDVLKERQPQASQFRARVIDAVDRRVVAVEFVRPGVAGSERARQYSIAAGRRLYRLTCAAPIAAFAGFEPICAHMVASFAVLP